MKVAVVGAGICGLAAAKTLCLRGHSVRLFEQFDLFHDRGSSHGESRIVRRAYSDAFYTACMAEAYPMWAELESESGRKLVDECGLLYFGSEHSVALNSVIAGLSDLKVPFEVLDHVRVRERLPQLRLSAKEIAIWTPEAGWVNAALALRTLYELASQNGLETSIGVFADPIALADEYDAVIVAAGAWTPRFAKVPAKVTLQTFAYVDAQVGGPVWIEDGPDLLYGMPSTPSGQKIGVHRAGAVIDPFNLDRTPKADFLEIIRRTAANRFGISGPQLRESKGCLYTTTPTEDFLLGRLAPNVYFASACSGHGFKLGLWIGCLLSDFVEGKDLPERHPRFFWK